MLFNEIHIGDKIIRKKYRGIGQCTGLQYCCEVIDITDPFIRIRIIYEDGVSFNSALSQSGLLEYELRP